MGTVETTEEINMDSKTAMKYLVSGYVKNNFTKLYNCDYPLSLNDVILSYLGTLFLSFDAIYEDYRYIIKNNGMNIKYDRKHACLVGSTYELNVENNSFKIKVINSGVDAIGIISDFNECYKKDLWFNKITGNAYMWYHYKDWGSSYISGHSSFQSKYHTSYPNGKNISHKWISGDIITVKINFKLWTVEFYKNDQLICDNIEIAKNLKYYPVISLNSIKWNKDQPIEYQILS